MAKIRMFGVGIGLLILSNAMMVKAQENPPLSQEQLVKLVNPDQNKWRNLFLSFGGDFIQKHAINAVLFAQDKAQIPTSLFYLGAGFSFRNEEYKNTFEAELGFTLSTNEEEEVAFGNTYGEFQMQLRYERKWLDVQSAFFSAGLQAKALFSRLELYPVDTTLDLDNLDFSNTSLFYQAFFLGPSLSINWINPNNQRLALRMVLSYNLNTYSNSWNVQSGDTLNSFNENASRTSFRLLIPLYF